MRISSSPVVTKLHQFTGHRDAIFSLARIDESSFLSAGSDGFVVRWNVHEPDKGTVVAQAKASIYAMNNKDNQEILFGQNYDGLRILNMNIGKTQSLQLTQKAIFTIESIGNKALIGTGAGVLHIIDKDKLSIIKEVALSDKSLRTLTIHPNGQELAAGYSDHIIRILDTQSWQIKYELAGHTNSVFSVVYSLNGQQLLSAGRDAHIKSWNTEKAYELTEDVVAHMYAINHLAYSPCGNYFASASMDKSIKLWQANPMRLLKVVDKARHGGHTNSVNRLLWLNNNTLVSASDDRSLAVWKVDF